MSEIATGGGSAAVAAPPADPEPQSPENVGDRPFLTWTVIAFLLPAVLLLGAIVIYPLLATIKGSFFDAAGKSWVGLHNYKTMFTSDATLTAIKNNAIWVLIAPLAATAIGLVFAVLLERVKWATAFKLVVFMPMAISFLAAGIIFRLVYDADPDRGLLNAAVVGVHDIFAPASHYPNARPRDTQLLPAAPGGGFQSSKTYNPGDTAELGLLAVQAGDIPSSAQDAAAPTAAPDAVTGTIWFDFTRGGGGEPNRIDPAEKGLPKLRVEAVRDGAVVAKATTDNQGRFSLSGLGSGGVQLRLAASNFGAPFHGSDWLGPTLATWSIIAAWIWMWAGFAMVLIAAGLAAISREALEAARVDGATEWQVFKRVTVPLLSPVLLVVLVTLVINVLKIFDLVFVLAPPSSQDDATVLAREMWTATFGGANDQGLGSALAIFLFVLVLPAMIFNIRRFRRDQA
ncbi:MAG TPA: sugar ABC transporter permease [Mycobacteriales bacterium]|nr:sugar ABC transporter permease [Mycobacteriales bacterium]